MISIRRLSFTLSILLFAVYAFGQNNQLELGKKYSVVRVQLKNDQVIKAKDLKLLNDSTLDFYEFFSRQYETLKVLDVKSISVKKGTYAVTCGIAGGVTGLFTSLILEVDSPYKFGTGFGITFALGGALIGGVLGTALGASIPKWNTIEFSNRATSYKIEISPSFDARSYGVGLKLGIDHN